MILDRFISSLDWLPFVGKEKPPEPPETPDQCLDFLDRFEASEKEEAGHYLKTVHDWTRHEDPTIASLASRVLAERKGEIQDPLERAQLLNGEAAGATYILGTFSVLDAGYSLRDEYADDALEALQKATRESVPESSVRTVSRFVARSVRNLALLDQKKYGRWQKKGEKLLQQWWKDGKIEVEREGKRLAPGSAELGPDLHRLGYQVQGTKIVFGGAALQPGPQAREAAVSVAQYSSYPGHPKGFSALEAMPPELAGEVMETLALREDLTESSSRYALSQLIKDIQPGSALEEVLSSKKDGFYQACAAAIRDEARPFGALPLAQRLLEHCPPPDGFVGEFTTLLMNAPQRDVRIKTGEFVESLCLHHPQKAQEALEVVLAEPLHRPLGHSLLKLMKTAVDQGWKPQGEAREKLEYRLSGERQSLPALKLEFQVRQLPRLETVEERIGWVEKATVAAAEDSSWSQHVQLRLLEAWTPLAQSPEEREAITRLLSGARAENEVEDLEVKFDEDFIQVGDFSLPVGDETGLPF